MQQRIETKAESVALAWFDYKKANCSTNLGYDFWKGTRYQVKS